MDPSRRLAFVTALHLEKHLLYGYVFRRQDYPWVMSWMNFTGDNRAARGMEFSSQPFDISHRETVAMSPAVRHCRRSGGCRRRRRSRPGFVIFYTRVPEGFTRIADVTLEGGKLTILDHSGKRVVLAASRDFEAEEHEAETFRPRVWGWRRFARVRKGPGLYCPLPAVSRPEQRRACSAARKRWGTCPGKIF